MDINELKNLSFGTSSYYRWRLRPLTEEQEIVAQNYMVEGVDAFQAAFSLIESGDKEQAVKALRMAISQAEKALEAVEK